jgi:myo-inositol 2-dehydrogenase/D-chiro-inositol 1-dehydrogenase
VVSPNHTHIQVMRDIADAPLHILLEKPISTSLADARELVELDDKRSHMTWIAMEYRYMSATAHFLDRLPELGDLKMLFIREHRGPFLKKVDNWNRFNQNSGGTLVEKCCHFFDLMNLAIDGQPIKATASGGQNHNHLDETYDGRAADILDNAFVIIDYDNGVRACLDLCMFAEGSINEQELVATGGQAKMEIHIPDNQFRFLPRHTKTPELYEVTHNPDIKFMGYHHGASYLEQLAFINAIKTGVEPTVTTRDGYLSMAMGIAAQQSIELGTSVAIEHLEENSA